MEYLRTAEYPSLAPASMVLPNHLLEAGNNACPWHPVCQATATSTASTNTATFKVHSHPAVVKALATHTAYRTFLHPPPCERTRDPLPTNSTSPPASGDCTNTSKKTTTATNTQSNSRISKNHPEKIFKAS